MKLRIGIHTCGTPLLTTTSDSTIVENALMGVGFHWEHTYPLKIKGHPEVLATPCEGISLICHIELEDYIRSVVSSEMNPLAPFEFIKAHAIIARSWAVNATSSTPTQFPDAATNHNPEKLIKFQDRDDHAFFDLCNDDHCQRFQGESAITPKAEEAVKATEGIVLTDRYGKIADTRYSKCCGGRTELFSTCWQDHDIDYLQSIEDPWCDLASSAPTHRNIILKSVLKDYDKASTPDFHKWKRTVTAKEIAFRLRRDFNIDIGTPVHLIPLHTGPSGRISLLRIKGTSGEISVGKELTIRKLLADDCLLSSAFKIIPIENGFELEGKGWGHGVGLCQIGAAAMAFHGFSASEILSHYYPHTTLSRIYD